MQNLSLFILLSIISSGSLASYSVTYGDFKTGLYASDDAACIAASVFLSDGYNFSGASDSGYTCQLDGSFHKWGSIKVETYSCEAFNSETLECNCEDGYPANIGGYTSCDRPALKQCLDGTIVDAATGICNAVCTDYDTCEEWAEKEADCASEGNSSIFVFSDYENPGTFNYTCKTIPIESPDHVDNGGNQDGNTSNDPISDPTTPWSESDPETISSVIDSALQNDFGNLERAIREGNDNADEHSQLASDHANTINDSLASMDSSLSERLDDIKTAIEAPVTISSKPLAERQVFGGFSDLTSKVEEARSNYDSSFNSIKIELSSTISTTFGKGSAFLPSFSFAWKDGTSFDADMNRWADQLAPLGNVLFAVASLMAAFIILRPR